MGINFWGNEETFNQDTFNSSMIPGNEGGQLSASQLGNIGNSNFGLQAGANGGQNFMQKLAFNAPSYDAQGVGTKGGMNLDGIGSILDGVGGIAEIYTALQSIGVAKDNLQFQKDSYNTNLGNQTQTYNTNLEDRVTSQYRTEGKTSADVDSYLQKNRL
jgi:hypothetical protein